MTRKAKIVATIGPASQSEDVLEKLILAGMNIARMNFSHGTHEQHAACIALLRQLSEKHSIPIGILQDLQGPKIRVGELPEIIQLAEDEIVTLYVTGTEPPGNGEKKIPVDFRQLFDSVHASDRLLLDDGRLTLEVVSVKDHNALTAKVIIGGPLSSHKGINLPGVRLRIAGFTEKDEADLAFGISHEVDAVAISFVRTAEDVKKVRYAMERFSTGKRLPLLIAKLEKPEALENLDAILELVDGVMVARGDLGVELPPERVPFHRSILFAPPTKTRSWSLRDTNARIDDRKPVATRAETSNVGNAVFDGKDAGHAPRLNSRRGSIPLTP